MQESCFWTVGDGDYAFIAQALVDSFHRVGMEGDFHVFSDREIQGAITHHVTGFDKRGCFFKLDFLKNHIKNWEYCNFIYLDADTLFLRRPPSLIELLQGDPLHFFLESDCTVQGLKRKNWWGCSLEEYVNLMRECGVTAQHVYNLNGGFFIVKKEAIDLVCDLAFDFAKYAVSKRFQLPDEPAFAFAVHMLTDKPEKHLLSRYRNVWGCDWEGVLNGHLPKGGSWVSRDYLSHEPHTVNPAIVHAIKSKDLLVDLGKISI